MMITRTPTTSDIAFVETHLRPDDRHELALSGGTLREAVGASALVETLATASGLPLALWGLRVDPDHPHYASIWMLCASDVEAYPSQFLRACPALVARAHESFPTLLCAAWKGNSLHLRWLRWLGFVPMVGMTVPDLVPHYHVLSPRNPAADAGRLGGRRSGAEASL